MIGFTQHAIGVFNFGGRDREKNAALSDWWPPVGASITTLPWKKKHKNVERGENAKHKFYSYT